MRPRRFAIATLLGTALLGIAAAPAAAVPVLIADAATGHPLASDGRYAAFLLGDRTIRAFDTLADTSFDIDVPPSCAAPVALEAVGGGQALVNCEAHGEVGREGTPLLLDLATRAWHGPVGATAFLDRMRGDVIRRFTDVGAQWMAGFVAGYHDYARVYLDWRTGSSVIGEGDRTVIPNLDASGVLRPLCEPFFRQHNPDSLDGVQFIDFPYDPPFRLLGMRLQACGSEASGLSLDNVRGVSSQLTDGYVTWIAPGRVTRLRAYLPECGMRFSWKVADAVAAVHTSRAIFAASSTARDAVGPYGIVRQTRPTCPLLTVPDAVIVNRNHVQRPAQLVSADWPEGSNGAAELLSPVRRTKSALPRRSGAVRIRARFIPRRVRWKVGAGPWHAASGRGTSWRLGTVSRGTVTIGLRTRDGATARYAVAVR